MRDGEKWEERKGEREKKEWQFQTAVKTLLLVPESVGYCLLEARFISSFL